MKYKWILVLITIFSLAFCNIENKVYREKLATIANYVNKKGTTWKAKIPNKDYSLALGTIKNKEFGRFLKIRERNLRTIEDLPENYDVREAFPECSSIIKEVPDQANCGSCWAIASASVISDRLCIKSHGKIKSLVSSSHIISCCKNCGGCKGGLPSSAFDFWITSGVVTGGKFSDNKTCKPYFLKPCDHYSKREIFGECPPKANEPECFESCQEGYKKDFDDDKSYGMNSYYLWDDEEEIMKEIYTNGPVVATFSVYEDFFTYEDGIYKYETGEYKGGHSVRIIGWGIENGIKYWICVNSWNENWGINGVFKILKGEDECGIEDSVIAGIPEI